MSDTGKAMALVSPDSERTFATYLGAAVELSAADITSQVFSGYDFFYVEGYLVSNGALFDKALRLAHKNKLRNCLDLASYNVVTQYRDVFRSYLKASVDIVFANEEESKALTGKNPEEAIMEMSSMTGIAVVKLGAEGSLVRSGTDQWHIPAINVKSIDTTGAGDLYAAGFLYGLGRRLSLEKCGQIGTLLASSVITVIGAKIPAERWEELRVEVQRIEEAVR
jgi:sugar/nucleoside kinase (ribokinase family)